MALNIYYDKDADLARLEGKTVALLGRKHPFPVQRVLELDRWYDSGAYQAVIDGDYPRRDSDPETSAWKAISPTVSVSSSPYTGPMVKSASVSE